MPSRRQAKGGQKSFRRELVENFFFFFFVGLAELIRIHSGKVQEATHSLWLLSAKFDSLNITSCRSLLHRLLRLALLCWSNSLRPVPFVSEGWFRRKSFPRRPEEKESLTCYPLLYLVSANLLAKRGSRRDLCSVCRKLSFISMTTQASHPDDVIN